ncbi:MAG: helix-turn-helix transcriptional regulator [Acidobacteria bacterium]|nr:helix-turn-helix transcriptional regulator [Acidobacteriota bacterium]
MQGYLLVYSFLCFSVGIACLSATFVSAKRKGDTLARAFLVFYVSLRLLVFGALLRTFIDILPYPVAPPIRFAIEYFEAIMGRYAVMFSLPFFAHRVFAVVDARRDYLLAGIVAAAVVIQHVTEFWLGGVWDHRGDVFEDVLTAGLVVYTLRLGFVHLGDQRVYRPLALRFLALLSIGLPGVAYDLFLSDDTALRFYPLGYCVASIVITWCLIRRPSSVRPGIIPPQWGLSQREAEVARLVQRGKSNKDIAEQLNISPNTVKTHLRAVFDKSGVRSRFELISATHQESFPETGFEPTNSR